MKAGDNEAVADKNVHFVKCAFRHLDAVTQSMCQFKMNGSAINLLWLKNVRNAEFCAAHKPMLKMKKVPTTNLIVTFYYHVFDFLSPSLFLFRSLFA